MSIKYKSTFLLIIENFEKPSCRQSYQTQQTTKKIFLTKTESIIIMVLSKTIYTKTKQQNTWEENESTKL